MGRPKKLVTQKPAGTPAKKKRVIPSNPPKPVEVLFIKDCKRIKSGEKRIVSNDTASILREKGFIK